MIVLAEEAKVRKLGRFNYNLVFYCKKDRNYKIDNSKLF